MDVGPPAVAAREGPSSASGCGVPARAGTGHGNGQRPGRPQGWSGRTGVGERDAPGCPSRGPGSAAKGAPAKALVLNASMDPLCVVSARRAVVLVLADKADVLHNNGHRFRSEHLDIVAPSVLRLRRYVHVPYRRRAALSRRGVFIRDEHTCQYCGDPAENVDHVVPRSRHGAHAWENVVAACRRCNSRKKDRTPDEAGMRLQRTPFAPRAAFWLVVAVGGMHPDWQVYLGDVTGQA